LHVDRSGAVATTNARLTSFVVLRILVTYAGYRRNPLNRLRPKFAKAPKPPVAPIAAVAIGMSVASVPVSVGYWPMPKGVPTMPRMTTVSMRLFPRLRQMPAPEHLPDGRVVSLYPRALL